MINVFRVAMLPILLCLAVSLPASGRKDNKNNGVQDENGPVIRVSGSVRLVGNEPFTQLVISGQDQQWYIERDDEPKLKDLQHRTVTVEGIETVVSLTFANGHPAGERRTLSKIKIISVQ